MLGTIRIRLALLVAAALVLATAPEFAAEVPGFEGLGGLPAAGAPGGASFAPVAVASGSNPAPPGESRPDEAADGPSFLPLRFEGRPVQPVSVVGGSLGFRLGRDNLAFVNPGGVMKLGGMAGNCYTMAFVAKLFFEDARYLPASGCAADGRRPAISLEALASHLAARRQGKFRVEGRESLFDLTSDPEPASATDLETRIHDRLRARAGLSTTAVVPCGDRMEELCEMTRFISAIHYNFYVQRTGQDFLRSVVAGRLAGVRGPATLTLQETDSIKAELARGRTALLCLWNNSIFFGHVILVHGCVSTADADYLICYDNNVQHGEERRHSVVRVARAGEHSIRQFLREPDGALSGGAGEACEVLLHLPDLTLAAGQVESLVRIVRHADQETAYLAAGSDFLGNLSQRSPAQAPLVEDLKQFLLNLQAIQTSLGLDGIAPADRIDAEASMDEVNRVLARYADLGVRTAVPYGLPPGLELSGTSLRFLEPNRARLQTSLSVAPGTSPRQLLEALERGAAVAGPGLARWLSSLRESAGSERLRADLAVDVSKGPAAGSVLAGLKASGVPYGPVVRLEQAHVVLGELEPDRSLTDPFVFEVSERVLQKGLDSLLARHGLDGSWQDLDDSTRLRLVSARVKLAGAIELHAGVELFRAVTSQTRGLVIQAPDVTARLALWRRPEDAADAWRVNLAFGGRFASRDGALGLGNLAVGAYIAFNRGSVGEAMRAAVLEAQAGLNKVAGEDLAGRVRLAQPLDMARGGSLLFHWGQGYFKGATPTAARSGEAGELMLGLERLGEGLPAPAGECRLREFRVGTGRLAISAGPATSPAPVAGQAD